MPLTRRELMAGLTGALAVLKGLPAPLRRVPWLTKQSGTRTVARRTPAP
jgi:hypothetical protein